MTAKKSCDDLLAEVMDDRVILQDYCPLADSLEWQLGQTAYWKARGHRAFLCDNVPFAINGDGRLSYQAALVLLESLRGAERENGPLGGRIYALEIGVGLGLFARLFLNAFRDLCHASHVDYYDRLCYIAADRSETMLDDICARGLLADHAGHHELIRLDAASPDLRDVMRADGPLRAVFMNYILDNLPFSVLSVEQGDVKQLCARTCVSRSCELSDYDFLNQDTIAGLASSQNPDEQLALLQLYEAFGNDFTYMPVDVGNIPFGDFALDSTSDESPYLLHSFGAICCLENLLDVLDDQGFVLINDYAHNVEKNPGGLLVEAFQHQRFGGSTAIGVNFPLLESWFGKTRNCRWVKPREDAEHICARLVGKPSLNQATVECFVEQFDNARFEWLQEPLERARRLSKEGRWESALGAFRVAIQRQPYNWVMLGELAEFLTQSLQAYAAGLEISSQAVELNPVSPELWNTHGDALFYLRRIEEAHNAFLRALELDPEDARTHLNLVYTYVNQRDYASALAEVAKGLLYDRTGEWRERLFGRQQEILQRLSDQHRRQAGFAANRLNWTDVQGLDMQAAPPSRPHPLYARDELD